MIFNSKTGDTTFFFPVFSQQINCHFRVCRNAKKVFDILKNCCWHSYFNRSKKVSRGKNARGVKSGYNKPAVNENFARFDLN
jgi:hypothetical protein